MINVELIVLFYFSFFCASHEILLLNFFMQSLEEDLNVRNFKFFFYLLSNLKQLNNSTHSCTPICFISIERQDIIFYSYFLYIFYVIFYI